MVFFCFFRFCKAKLLCVFVCASQQSRICNKSGDGVFDWRRFVKKQKCLSENSVENRKKTPRGGHGIRKAYNVYYV